MFSLGAPEKKVAIVERSPLVEVRLYLSLTVSLTSSKKRCFQYPTVLAIVRVLQWNLFFGTHLFKGHLHSGETKNLVLERCSHNICI